LAFKKEIDELPSWEKGAPRRVNKLTSYTAQEIYSMSKFNKSARLPGHVRGGMNFNTLRDKNNDNITLEMVDGMKSIVCKLKDNEYGFTSIARPTDENNIPDWFKVLPFDDVGMAETQIDKKVDNLLGVLKWDLDISTDTTTTFTKLFEF